MFLFVELSFCLVYLKTSRWCLVLESVLCAYILWLKHKPYASFKTAVYPGFFNVLPLCSCHDLNTNLGVVCDSFRISVYI